MIAVHRLLLFLGLSTILFIGSAPQCKAYVSTHFLYNEQKVSSSLHHLQRKMRDRGLHSFRRRQTHHQFISCQHHKSCLHEKENSAIGDIDDPLNPIRPSLKRSNRRDFIQSLGIASIFCSSKKALARGLVRLPCKYRLGNTYHFVRAGQSLLEEENVLSTNPLFLTNREAALSELGAEQIRKACRMISDDNVRPTIVRYSLAAASMNSADIVGDELKVGRDSLVPEFTFMDPRALGKWDMLPLDSTEAAVWAMDNDEAGTDGLGGRPPANEDSTPHETLADQVVRLRQLISVLETQYSGDTVLLIFPDGTGPALLECMMAGIPLNKVHEMNYESGEMRLDITYDNIRERMPSVVSEVYSEKLALGRDELPALRKNPDEIINVKDRQYAEELRQYQEEKARADVVKEKEAVKEEQAKEELRRQVKKDREKKRVTEGTNKEGTNDSNMMVAGVGAFGIGGGTLAIFGGDSVDDSKNITSAVDVVEVVQEINITAIDSPVMKSEIKSIKARTDFDEELQDVIITAINDIPVMKIDINDLALPFGDNLHASEKSHSSSNKEVFLTEVTETDENVTLHAISENQIPLYLDINKEDGGDAWLGMLSDMIVEEDNEVDVW